MEDAAIVALYLRREEDAIRQTADKYGFRLRNLALGITEDAQTAEECENDTYLQAWNSIPPHEPMDYLYAYLSRITRHLALNCCRDRERLKRKAHISQLSVELEQCIGGPDNAAEHMDELALRTAINGFLSTLPEQKRSVFLRRYWYMDSVAAIADRYGLSESKVKTILFRCRHQLRQQLKKEGFFV